MRKKKSLGQHFLHGAAHVRAIADAAEIAKGDTVVEIGPGEGALTQELLARGAHVVAIEKDARLIPVLREKFKRYDISKLRVIEGDALDFDVAALQIKNWKLIGNIPYYITGALFKKFLSGTHQPSLLVFLVQKEVAERIARDKKGSIAALSVKAYGTPRYVKTVPRGAFVPPPKVDSAILAVSGISRARFAHAAHEKRFFELIKKAFGQKRKVLKNTLGDVGALAQKRPEDLSLPDWLALSA